jgi:outer membrane protein TolC
MFLLICRWLAIVVPAVLLLPQLASAQQKLDPEVEAVLRERLAALSDAAKFSREKYQMGTITFDRVLAAEINLGQAELELAATSAERVRIREALLKKAEEFEKVVETYIEAGRQSHMELLLAKAARLRAKADLLLEKKAAAR